MDEWEDWELPYSKYKKIMPSLCHLTLFSCSKLIELPSLGKLESLEIIELNGLPLLKEVGAQFLGISDDEDRKRRMVAGGESVQEREVIFPRLTELSFRRMKKWEEWTLPFKKDNIIMPHLRELTLFQCTKLKRLPALGKLQSLENLALCNMDAVGHLSADLLGVSGGGSGNLNSTSSTVVEKLFPKLTNLCLTMMPHWEEQNNSTTTITSSSNGTTVSVMPCLHTLRISKCDKLMVVPHSMFCHELRILEMEFCPQLTGNQTCLPPLLQRLQLWGDVGVLSRSLPVNSTESYPNLKYVTINSSPHSMLPQGLNQFKSLQQLEIFYCKTLDIRMEELKQIASLQELTIEGCSVLTEHCRQDWSTLSHIPKIIIDNKEITERN